MKPIKRAVVIGGTVILAALAALLVVRRTPSSLVLRMYGPTTRPPTIVDGSWTPPPVKRAP